MTEVRMVSELYGLFPDHEDFLAEHIVRHFVHDDTTLIKVRDLLDQNITDALNPGPGKHSPLGICPSYVCDIPTGEETGVYLGIDLGGTNARSMLVRLDGRECETKLKSSQIPTEMLQQSGTELFDFLADLIYSTMKENDILDTDYTIPLGFTFSYPVKQTAIDNAVLLQWTKNFTCTGVEGKNVGELLNDAIKRKGGIKVKCVAIVNDTVGTLLSGTLKDRHCSIGLGCGTGTNASYFEATTNMTIGDGSLANKQQVAIDTKWNNFGEDGSTDFLRSEYDIEVTTSSTHSKRMIFEKMMCGMYLGEITRLVLKRMHSETICFQGAWDNVLYNKHSITSKLVAEIASNEDDKKSTVAISDLGVHNVTDTESKAVKYICQLVVHRAASLTAACLSCLVRRVGNFEVGIAVDGSFFTGSAFFRTLLHEKLRRLVEKDVKTYFIPCPDGSGVGGAIMASVLTRMGKPNN